MMVSVRHLAALLAAVTAGTATVPANAQTRPPAPAVTCTNPASGTTWQISIDYDKATVDTNPARVSDGEISWRDAKDGWNYTLDRRSGELTVAIASSTGGYFLHDRCRLPR